MDGQCHSLNVKPYKVGSPGKIAEGKVQLLAYEITQQRAKYSYLFTDITW